MILAAIVLQIMHMKNYKGIPKQTESVYVNYFTNVLSEDTKEYIIKYNEYFDSKIEKPKIVVTTIGSFSPYMKWDYINKMFRLNNVNDGFRKNGILVIYSKQDDKFYTESWLAAYNRYTTNRFRYLRESSDSFLKKIRLTRQF